MWISWKWKKKQNNAWWNFDVQIKYILWKKNYNVGVCQEPMHLCMHAPTYVTYAPTYACPHKPMLTCTHMWVTACSSECLLVGLLCMCIDTCMVSVHVYCTAICICVHVCAYMCHVCMCMCMYNMYSCVYVWRTSMCTGMCMCMVHAHMYVCRYILASEAVRDKNKAASNNTRKQQQQQQQKRGQQRANNNNNKHKIITRSSQTQQNRRNVSTRESIQ